MDGIHFDEESHVYTVNGERVDSVTKILKVATGDDYAFVTDEMLKKSSELGKAVHLMIHLDCNDNLDVSHLDEEMMMYYRAWKNFLLQSGFSVYFSEMIVYSEQHKYIGQLDLFGKMGNKFVLIDAKRVNVLQRAFGPQTAAYKKALAETVPSMKQEIESAECCALMLQTNGKWQLEPSKQSDDFKVFLSCLTIHNWKKRK